MSSSSWLLFPTGLLKSVFDKNQFQWWAWDTKGIKNNCWRYVRRDITSLRSKTTIIIMIMVIRIIIYLLSMEGMLHELSHLIFTITLWGQWQLLSIWRNKKKFAFQLYKSKSSRIFSQLWRKKFLVILNY